MSDFKHIGIVGIGLIGGSLAKAFLDLGLRVSCLDKSSETLALAENFGGFEAVTGDCDQFLSLDIDLIYICTHLTHGLEFLEVLSRKGVTTLVTDSFSTKGSVVSKASELGLNFVGSHPIAGCERSGFANSDPRLLDGADYIVVGDEACDFAIKLGDLHRSLGMKVYYMDAKTHDRVFCLTSHLPHILSYSLVRMVMDSELGEDFSFGGSFRDISRVAGSNPDLWKDIFLDNRSNLVEAIERFKHCLDNFKALIEDCDDDLLTSLRDIAEFRKGLY